MLIKEQGDYISRTSQTSVQRNPTGTPAVGPGCVLGATFCVAVERTKGIKGQRKKGNRGG